MSAARPTSATPLVKQEESAIEADNLLHSGNDVSEADVELLLSFRRGGAQARVSTPPASASRVSISALLNSEEGSTSRNPATPHAAAKHLPATPRPSTSSSAVSPTHPPPPSRTPVTPNSKPSDMPALASTHKPPLTLERDLDRATKSMSISVEPEVIAPFTTRALSPPASPVTPRPNIKAKPTKFGKGRGRVSKGPKKRQGKGWIIESCTTSGAASDAELELEPETGTSQSPEQSPEKNTNHKPIVLKQLQELFDGDSDLTDLDDLGGRSSSSSDEETLEYDPGLAGLPPVPASSDSEYAPRNGSTPRLDGEQRTRRRSRTSLDYGGERCLFV